MNINEYITPNNNIIMNVNMTCSQTDAKFASIASEEAYKSKLLSRHGCVAVSSGKIIARGCNTYRTYSNDGFMKNSCSCHAEINVMRQCYKQKAKKINLYIVRITAEGLYVNSAPCSECIKLIKFLPFVKNFIYTGSDGKLIKKKPIDYTNAHDTNGNKAIHVNRVKYNVIHRRQKHIRYEL